jgi:hypothetical protein
MDAYEEAAARVGAVQARTMAVLRTLQTCERVKMYHDGHDEARVLAMLKHVMNECTEKQEFSEWAILLATLSLDTRKCPICS